MELKESNRAIVTRKKQGEKLYFETIQGTIEIIISKLGPSNVVLVCLVPEKINLRLEKKNVDI